jgi:hypothetical protein
MRLHGLSVAEPVPAASRAVYAAPLARRGRVPQGGPTMQPRRRRGPDRPVATPLIESGGVVTGRLPRPSRRGPAAARLARRSGPAAVGEPGAAANAKSLPISLSGGGGLHSPQYLHFETTNSRSQVQKYEPPSAVREAAENLNSRTTSMCGRTSQGI